MAGLWGHLVWLKCPSPVTCTCKRERRRVRTKAKENYIQIKCVFSVNSQSVHDFRFGLCLCIYHTKVATVCIEIESKLELKLRRLLAAHTSHRCYARAAAVLFRIHSFTFLTARVEWVRLLIWFIARSRIHFALMDFRDVQMQVRTICVH